MVCLTLRHHDAPLYSCARCWWRRAYLVCDSARRRATAYASFLRPRRVRHHLLFTPLFCVTRRTCFVNVYGVRCTDALPYAPLWRHAYACSLLRCSAFYHRRRRHLSLRGCTLSPRLLTLVNRVSRLLALRTRDEHFCVVAIVLFCFERATDIVARRCAFATTFSFTLR